MAEPTSVLVVDDNEDLLATFSLILKRRGFNVDTAGNGAAAVDKFKAHQSDIILMDIVMPEMNGVEAFRKIREINPEATVILMTAYSEDELIKAAVSEGVHRVMHKPIRVDQMIGLLKEAATSRSVLIVDDDDDVRQTMARALELEGYQVVTAGSGEEALKVARENNCRVAFVDIKLPLMDGLETYLRLKEINPNLVAIMITGFRDEVKEALDKAMAAKAITCLYKPFDPTMAIDVLSRLGKK
ncbi:MAG: response regulator [Dehalococcoidales bacterium]|nr:response regulator [Dehalococcoidales bacterium]